MSLDDVISVGGRILQMLQLEISVATVADWIGILCAEVAVHMSMEYVLQFLVSFRYSK